MTLSGATARRWIVAAVAVGVALRLAFGLLYWVGKPLTHDEREYLALAGSLTAGRGFAYEPQDPASPAPQFGRAPAYPVFLALVGAGGGEYDSSPARVKIAQACVGGLTVWLVGLIALGAAGPRAGAVAAAVAAVYPPLVWISAYVFSETLFSPCALGAAHVLQRAVGTPPGRRRMALSLAAGGLTGLAILIRPVMLFFVPLAVLWLAGHRRVAVALAFTAATVAVVAPWTIRNAIVYERFVLVASEGGVTFWTGNHPLARGDGDLAANPDLKRAEVAFRRAHAGLTPEELEPLYYRAALEAIAEDPLRWMGLMARKLFYTVVPAGPSYRLHSTRYWAASLLSYGLLLPVAIAGFRRLWRSERRPAALLLLGGSAVLASLIFFPQERFRIPVIDPVLIVAASAVAAGRGRPPGPGDLA